MNQTCGGARRQRQSLACGNFCFVVAIHLQQHAGFYRERLQIVGRQRQGPLGFLQSSIGIADLKLQRSKEDMWQRFDRPFGAQFGQDVQSLLQLSRACKSQSGFQTKRPVFSDGLHEAGQKGADGVSHVHSKAHAIC